MKTIILLEVVSRKVIVMFVEHLSCRKNIKQINKEKIITITFILYKCSRKLMFAMREIFSVIAPKSCQIMLFFFVVENFEHQ